ncbi:MAG TPA: Wzz/FepE/Etk N-terminal domain-containing protein [Rhizomicrobium sp.]|nr:Wzz/FepE/Etk N-terminal domain-containing protein [Rhizomicrobium sp.]
MPAGDVADPPLNLRYFVNTVRANWLLIVGIVIGCLAVGFAYGVLSRPHYKATVILAPATNPTAASAGTASFGNYRDLASLAGVSLPTESNKATAVALLSSWIVTDRYVRDAKLEPILFAKDWDPATKTWKDGKEPDYWMRFMMFNSLRTVDPDQKTGFTFLSIEWTDPVQAAQWANGMAQEVNDYMRQKAIDDAQRHINFLNKQLDVTTNSDLRLVLSSLEESELKNLMMASGNSEFAFKVVDPAVVPKVRTGPHRMLILLGSLFVGLTLNFGWILFRHFWRGVMRNY